MTILILGLALWYAAHFFKPAMPAQRAAMTASMGEKPARGVMAALILGSVALMVIGYKQADFDPVWNPPAMLTHINNLMMLIAVGLYGASHSKGNAKRYVRHPMLVGTAVWAVAHLLVNGDVASIVLFGAMLVWAVVSISFINKRDGEWVKPAPGPRKKDFILVGITLVVFGVITVLHSLAGVSPFPMSGS
jgi:uncharacterized membrane protein